MSPSAHKRIPGAHTELATPVTIPTTEVKQLGPMIVRLRESRLVPGPYSSSPGESVHLGSFFFGGSDEGQDFLILTLCG